MKKLATEAYAEMLSQHSDLEIVIHKRPMFSNRHRNFEPLSFVPASLSVAAGLLPPGGRSWLIGS